MLYTGDVTETSAEVPREERQTWRFQRRFRFLSGSVLEQWSKKQQFQKENTTEVPREIVLSNQICRATQM